MLTTEELFSIKEASDWATEYLGKNVTTSNISSLIQYGRIKKIGDNSSTQISESELKTKTFQYCLTGDSRTIDIFKELENKNPA